MTLTVDLSLERHCCSTVCREENASADSELSAGSHLEKQVDMRDWLSVTESIMLSEVMLAAVCSSGAVSSAELARAPMRSFKLAIFDKSSGVSCTVVCASADVGFVDASYVSSASISSFFLASCSSSAFVASDEPAPAARKCFNIYSDAILSRVSSLRNAVIALLASAFACTVRIFSR